MGSKAIDNSTSSIESWKNDITNENCATFIKINGVSLPKSYLDMQDDIENFEVRDDDVWLCGYPRSGTTWAQEMIWCIANDLDFEGAKEILPERFPFLEYSCLIDPLALLASSDNVPSFMLNSVNYVNEKPLTNSRFIKTHLPYKLLPRQLRTGEKKAKIIYVVRNPKDTCVSFFHFCKLKKIFSTNLETICELFLDEKLPFTPYWDHVHGFWNRRSNLPNCLFLKYEDMKADLPKVIQKVAEFLDKPEPTEQQMKLLTDHLSIQSMKKNPAVNAEDYQEDPLVYGKPLDSNESFIRAGETESWKKEMPPKMVSRFEAWIKENLKDSDYEL